MPKSTDDPGSAADLSHDPLERVVRPDLLPVNVWKGVVGQRLMDALLDEVGGLAHFTGSKILDDHIGFLIGGCPALLCVDSLEHVAHITDPCCRHVAEDIPVEMHHAALPASLGEIVPDALDQPAAGVGNDQLHALEAAIDQVPQNADQPDLSSLAPSQM